MAYGRRDPSIFDAFTLSPLPYPVILILLMVLLLLGISWSFSYEDLIESTEEQLNWLLLATPIALLLLIRWISSVESFDGGIFGFYPGDRRRRGYAYVGEASEGSSPWGVAAVVVLLLVLVSFQSSFQDMWRP
ncbi:uncharacterized protein LOC109825580 [Asparagus officinalis]|uniref:uncharacterized protein LOC109825580 n=1 Tax=Asparagus officinalis TaxID=4686 RepID=UPI00098E4B2A|nr:uncharacterized protein LOC109825580 [Asparagus officinalis]